MDLMIVFIDIEMNAMRLMYAIILIVLKILVAIMAKNPSVKISNI